MTNDCRLFSMLRKSQILVCKMWTLLRHVATHGKMFDFTYFFCINWKTHFLLKAQKNSQKGGYERIHLEL